MCIGLILAGKLFLVQIVHGGEYADQASHQYSYVPGASFDRGDIYFTDALGARSLAATMKTGYILAINPEKISNAEDVYKKLNVIVPIDHADFTAKVSKKNDPYEELAKELPKDVADTVTKAKISGVSVSPESWRFYPGGNLASQVVGFTGFQGNTGDARIGVYGIERQFEDVLNRAASNLYQNFFAEIFSDAKKATAPKDKRDGSVVLTIEPKVQALLQDELAAVRAKWSAKRAGGIIINPKTGEIYAMGDDPGFDPNNYGQITDESVFKNAGVENLYEMGSTMKAITIASGIDDGAITASTTYDDKGFVELNGKKVSNYDHRGRGVVSMQEVLKQSLNTGTVFTMQKMGREAFRNYMLGFGLGDTTGIDLPAEAVSLTDNLHSNEDVDYATVSFGQGIAVSPIEMTRALSALANGGVLIKPHVVSAVDYELGGEDKRVSVEQGRAIKEASSEEITRMLVRVVDEALAHGALKHEHYSIAAKTGTAQVVNPATHEYYPDQFFHSFFGYFPAYDPKFLIFLYLEFPQNVDFASQTLTDTFGHLTDFLLHYYNVPPDR